MTVFIQVTAQHRAVFAAAVKADWSKTKPFISPNSKNWSAIASKFSVQADRFNAAFASAQAAR